MNGWFLYTFLNCSCNLHNCNLYYIYITEFWNISQQVSCDGAGTVAAELCARSIGSYQFLSYVNWQAGGTLCAQPLCACCGKAVGAVPCLSLPPTPPKHSHCPVYLVFTELKGAATLTQPPCPIPILLRAFLWITIHAGCHRSSSA